MNKSFIAFAIGCIAGAMATAIYYDYKNKQEEPEETSEEVKENRDETIKEHLRLLEAEREKLAKIRRDISLRDKKEALKTMEENDSCYEITKDEFGEYPDYDCIYLTYFCDGVLTDEYFEELDNVELSEELKDIADEVYEDIVFARNDHRKCDYEITFDVRRYEDARATLPRPTYIDETGELDE